VRRTPAPVLADDRAAPSPAGSGPAVPRPESGFRPDIEGLRAVAIVLVVLYHAGVPWLTGGYVGVDVFFVISGFLITSQLFGELTRTGRISIRRFYARRAIRLLPAATLVIGATVVASWLWLPPTRFREVAYDALAATGYAINYRLAIQGTDYLAAARAPSPLQHYWSLAVEEQFYLIWPLLLILVSLWALSRVRRNAILALSTVTVLSFGIGLWQTNAAAPWAYFGAPARIWELGVGALLALARPALGRLGPVVGWLGAAAIVASAFWFSEATPFPGYAAVLPVLGAAAIIGGGLPVLGLAPMRVLGRLSYSWYLWHWPVLVILRGSESVGRGLLLALGSLVLAGLTYVAVENPVRYRRSLRERPWRGLALGGSLSAGTAALALLAASVVPAPVGSGTAVDTRAVLASSASPRDELTSLVAAGVSTVDLPANLSPSPQDVARDVSVVYQDGCHADFGTATVKTPCAYGDLRSGTTVVLFGDSHAAQWFAALNAVALSRHWRLVAITKSACSAATAPTYLPQFKREYTECERWRGAAVAYIRSLRPALVVMSSIATGVPPLRATDPVRAWTDAWVSTIHALRPTPLALISDTPAPRTDIPDCVSANYHDLPACVTPLSAALPAAAVRTSVADAATREGVRVVDPVPWLCTATTCPVVVGNVLVYRDDSHLSTAYATLLAPFLSAALP
jgi:peptidoglycan/LPS O-acetylase OafA/YrhL